MRGLGGGYKASIRGGGLSLGVAVACSKFRKFILDFTALSAYYQQLTEKRRKILKIKGLCEFT